MNRELRHFVRDTVQWARRLRGDIASRLRSDHQGQSLRTVRDWVQSATAAALSQDDFADLYAQTVACCAAVLSSSREKIPEDRAIDWLLANSTPLWQIIWSDCLGLSADRETDAALAQAKRRSERPGRLATHSHTDSYGPDPIVHFYEAFLAQYDSARRTAHGVFYTPGPVAKYIIQQIDQFLCDEFSLRDGLADTATWSEYARRHEHLVMPRGLESHRPFVAILDPAAGTGAFLVEAIDLIHRKLAERWIASGCDAAEVSRRWNDYVPRRLLPRIVGLELMLPACAVAQLNLVCKLAETGFSFAAPARLELHLTNTLVGPKPSGCLPDGRAGEVARAVDAARRASYAMPYTVVIGNPPFSGLSVQQGRWISELLRGKSLDAGKWANYYEVDGQPLGERKHWLQDDYVKFIRYAQWIIEAAGCGIIGLVSNHGYLDNATFRGMRQQLLRTFSRIAVVDLHGNRKKKERPPHGGVDENVFATEQGTAIGIFRRLPWPGDRCQVRRAELWGAAAGKLAALSSAAATGDGNERSKLITATPLKPRGPDYAFVRRDDAIWQEYERGYRLSDIMPVNVTAPVTARDSFVVAFDQKELLSRVAQFRDLSIPDEEIRRRYFTNSRSARYPPGDTRGWKLPVARRRMAEEEHWRHPIRPCWYRPFDRRVIYWAEWMIDWPRGEVMRHILAGNNMAIVARRQMLPTQPCNFFWITDALTLDGVIRSDNRGSESIFPVYLYEVSDDGTMRSGEDAHVGRFSGSVWTAGKSRTAGTSASASRPKGRRANFSQPFIANASRTLRLAWTADGAGDLRQSFGPEDLAHYCYALFFSPTYRERYAEVLRADFPRVFLPRHLELFRTLRRIGARLADRHLLRTAEDSQAPVAALAGADSDGCWSLGRGFPKYRDGRVFVNDRCWFDEVPQQVWDFHTGAHQVCKKWLKDRRGRRLSREEAAIYCRIAASLAETLRGMSEIDEAITDHGGWPQAFE